MGRQGAFPAVGGAMKISTNIKEQSGYLEIEAAGEWVFAEMKQLAETLAAEARGRGFKRVLLDALKISPPQLNHERLLLGKHVPSIFTGLRVAVVFHPSDINYYFETTAVNQGAQVRVEADRQEALRWLLSEESTARPPIPVKQPAGARRGDIPVALQRGDAATGMSPLLVSNHWKLSWAAGSNDWKFLWSDGAVFVIPEGVCASCYLCLMLCVFPAGFRWLKSSFLMSKSSFLKTGSSF